MANQSKLKAWVRYDGTGRVVTAGPIFQANKPKVGNWRQINSSLCCNPSGSTTTTTTGGGSVTPTAFVEYYYTNAYDACNASVSGSLVFYSASTVIAADISIFQDAALTIPVTIGQVILTVTGGETRYLVGAGGLLSVYNCPVVSYSFQSGWSYMDRGEACTYSNYATLYAGSPNLGPYVNVYLDNQLTQLAPYAYVASGGYSYQCVNGNLQTQQPC